MQSTLISDKAFAHLICPATKGPLQYQSDHFSSTKPQAVYPIIDGIPVLINDDRSVFSVSDFETKRDTTFELTPSPVKDFLNSLIPTISLNLKSRANYKKLADKLPPNSMVLILGGSIRGEGMEALFDRDDLDIVSSDVSFGPDTSLICDAHDIPFTDNTFDCVIAQAVLEHVLDPTQCVNEIHRVLKPQGIVYAETPFMQQVHMKQYDFTRFTHLGHRRLFRYFDEIDSGPTAGPGSAVAWSWVYLFRSFSTNRWLSRIFNAFAHFTSFFWKYIDYLVIDKPGSFDAASGLFFFGTKSEDALSDKALLAQFKGIK